MSEVTSNATALGLEVLGPVRGEQTEILSPEAMEFFVQLHREFTNPNNPAN